MSKKDPVPAKSRVQAVCKQVAAVLQKERERKNLSKTVLGELAGLSQQSVSYIERGMRIPNLDTLVRITDALGVELSEIIARATPPPKRRNR